MIIFVRVLDYKMRKYYYITVIAVAAIVLLQAFYVMSLYNRYVDENITKINDAVRVSIDKELHLRSVYLDGEIPRKHQYISIQTMDDMSPREIDSLKRLSPIPTDEKHLYNIDAAREKGIAQTSAELISQVLQDKAFEGGVPLNLNTLDSIFVKNCSRYFPHTFFLYNKDKQVVASAGELEIDDYGYTSNLIPIGIKGLQYLQIKANIQLLPFLLQDVWTLILSAILMVFVVLCMAYHLIVIRRNDRLLQRREDTINGTIHDLKTPLNSVVATLGWLKSDESNLSKKKAIEISHAEVKHLVCNIESLLVTVRKDRKRLVLKKDELNVLLLAEVVKSGMDALYHTKPHNIEIVNDLPEGVTVFADGMYLENVIRNLVENALKYSDNGVTVKVILSVAGGMLQVSVQDNGWGIAPQYQKKLFRQFYQVPRGEEKIRSGYGIGLAQSKYIIGEHKGKISVKSAEGEGSVFMFTIPLA